MTELNMTKSKMPLFVPTPSVSHLPLLDPTQNFGTQLMRVLAHALSLKRDHGSRTEAEFVSWLVNRLPVTMIDGAGNIHVDRRRLPSHRSLFTSHTDTVHHSGGHNHVRIDGHIWRADRAALGADDGAGIALMCHMIERGVSGYFIFFRGEERGGVGSSWLADNMPELLEEFDRAVAFDRAGYTDVITHQSGGRCCSNTFAEALSDQLNDQGMLYMPCDGGVYTDTAEFIRLIPECTNLSVGYKYQHGDREEQDVKYLQVLAEALVAVNWDKLPTERDPRVREMPWSHAAMVGHTSYKSFTPMAAAEMDKVDEVAEACEMWLGNVTRTDLLNLIAAHIMPEDPQMARRFINPLKLRDVDVERALEELYNGWDAETVLQDLYDSCEVI
jgi:hypothetical protein